MGVRGLTTFIERNEGRCFTDYELHDTQLVIDGYSLCAQIYKYHSRTNDIFGGDYDIYADSIRAFFSRLDKCNVTPIVIMDGGYEKKKCKTVYDRMKNKLKLINQMNFTDTIFPLFLREILKDILLELNICLLRCDFEADLDIACVAKKLKCPVLSYDSDFFIFDVSYIPFTKMNTCLSSFRGFTFFHNYIGCKMYTVDNFLKCFDGLQKSHMPLLATLLGNDYIRKSAFNKFYDHIKLPRKCGMSDQVRRITALIQWLRGESFSSAVRKILGRMKKDDRIGVAQEIDRVMETYLSSKSDLLVHFNLKPEATQECKITALSIANGALSESASDNENDSNSDAESDESFQMIEPTLQLSEITTLNSRWFKANFRFGKLPSMFMDILTLNTCYYSPQVENISNIKSVEIIIPILKVISKILLRGRVSSIWYLARDENARVHRYRLNLPKSTTPPLDVLEKYSVDRRTTMLLYFLHLTVEDFEGIRKFPEDWRLYLVSLIYWCRNSVIPKANICHISSIILCLINMKIVDKHENMHKVRFNYRSKTAPKGTNLTGNLDSEDVTNVIKTVAKEDCLVFIESFVVNFIMDTHVQSGKKTYSISVVDAFAQFQSCLLFIKHLNALLNFPILDYNISDYYNGTYLYNVYRKLEIRADAPSYISGLLAKSPLMFYVFMRILDFVNFMVGGLTEAPGNKKRKRKRKRRKKQTVAEGESSTEDSFEEYSYDVNNKFSILAMHE